MPRRLACQPAAWLFKSDPSSCGTHGPCLPALLQAGRTGTAGAALSTPNTALMSPSTLRSWTAAAARRRQQVQGRQRPAGTPPRPCRSGECRCGAPRRAMQHGPSLAEAAPAWLGQRRSCWPGAIAAGFFLNCPTRVLVLHFYKLSPPNLLTLHRTHFVASSSLATPCVTGHV